MLEKIEVGKDYIDEYGVEWEAAKYLPATLQWVFIRLTNSGYIPIVVDKREWQKLKLKKEEPKKLGQLYMCVKRHGAIGKDALRVLNSLSPSREYWQPVTINDKGEVYSV